ncbi:unnamed protein product, partial [Prorocentrum cordatum]
MLELNGPFLLLTSFAPSLVWPLPEFLVESDSHLAGNHTARWRIFSFLLPPSGLLVQFSSLARRASFARCGAALLEDSAVIIAECKLWKIVLSVRTADKMIRAVRQSLAIAAWRSTHPHASGGPLPHILR